MLINHARRSINACYIADRIIIYSTDQFSLAYLCVIRPADCSHFVYIFDPPRRPVRPADRALIGPVPSNVPTRRLVIFIQF